MKSYYRKMRIILIFDLPSVEKEDISYNQKFVKNLKKLGLYMIQYSVYTKSLQNHSEYDRLLKKIYKIIPNKGNIIMFKLTEKQYSDMIYLSGEKNLYESRVGSKEIIFFGGE